MLLKAACINESYVHRPHIPIFMRILQRMAREHLSLSMQEFKVFHYLPSIADTANIPMNKYKEHEHVDLKLMSKKIPAEQEKHKEALIQKIMERRQGEYCINCGTTGALGLVPSLWFSPIMSLEDEQKQFLVLMF